MGKIADAIAAAEAPQPDPRVAVQVTLRTGRTVAINVPLDLSPIEAIDLVGYIATKLPATLAGQQGRGRPSLLVPTGPRIARG